MPLCQAPSVFMLNVLCEGEFSSTKLNKSAEKDRCDIVVFFRTFYSVKPKERDDKHYHTRRNLRYKCSVGNWK